MLQILALLVFGFIVLLAVWNVLEIAYRIVMVVIYGTAYIAVTIYEWLGAIGQFLWQIIKWTLAK